MESDDVLAYVTASAKLLAIPMDDARTLRVAQHMERTAGLARLLETAALGPEDELAEIYCPAPFPNEAPQP